MHGATRQAVRDEAHTWLVAAVALAAFLWWRRRRLEHGADRGRHRGRRSHACLEQGLTFELPSIDKVLEDMSRALGKWTYLLVAILAFLEAGAFVGLLIPGETAIIVAGVVAARPSTSCCSSRSRRTRGRWRHRRLHAGRRLGRPFLVKHGPVARDQRGAHPPGRRVLRQARRQGDLRRALRRPRALPLPLPGRVLGDAAAAVACPTASSGPESIRRVVPSIGYVFWHSLDRVLEIAKQGALALVRDDRRARRDRRRRALGAQGRGTASACPPGSRPTRKETGDAAAARRQAPRAASRDVRVGPPAPGDLGLRSPRCSRPAVVGGYVLFGYMLVLDDVGLTPGDSRAVVWSDAVTTGVFDALASAAEQLGSLPVVAVVVVLVAAGLYRGPPAPGVPRAHRWAGADRRRRRDRRRGARPPGARRRRRADLPDVNAAYAASWIAGAVALRHATGPITRTAAAVTVGIVLSCCAPSPPCTCARTGLRRRRRTGARGALLERRGGRGTPHPGAMTRAAATAAAGRTRSPPRPADRARR